MWSDIDMDIMNTEQALRVKLYLQSLWQLSRRFGTSAVERPGKFHNDMRVVITLFGSSETSQDLTFLYIESHFIAVIEKYHYEWYIDS